MALRPRPKAALYGGLNPGEDGAAVFRSGIVEDPKVRGRRRLLPAVGPERSPARPPQSDDGGVDGPVDTAPRPVLCLLGDGLPDGTDRDAVGVRETCPEPQPGVDDFGSQEETRVGGPLVGAQVEKGGRAGARREAAQRLARLGSGCSDEGVGDSRSLNAVANGGLTGDVIEGWLRVAPPRGPTVTLGRGGSLGEATPRSPDCTRTGAASGRNTHIAGGRRLCPSGGTR